MMLYVIDSNQLQSPKLRHYLASSKNNYAVLTDYSAIEAYKGNAFNSIFKSMEIVSDYPAQIIILRNTSIICQLIGTEEYIKSCLIDQYQTSNFKVYCHALRLARAGDAKLKNDILSLGEDATAQIDRMLLDASLMGGAFDELIKKFTKEERSKIRDDDIYTAPLLDKIIQNTIDIALDIFNRLLINSGSELYSTFIFRNSLCCYLLALEWGVMGGAKKAKHERLRNDMVDTHFATYATFYDGLLSEDIKAVRIYTRASRIIKIIS